jgi:hypothetical protein
MNMKRILFLLFLAFSTIVTAQRRTGIQDYTNVTALQAETLTPQQNDKVFVKATRYLYTWDANSTATHDGVTVIKQTNIATGRFLLSATDKSAIGLSNVDNTSDANKPISMAQQTALNSKQANTQYQKTGTNIGSSGGVSTLNFVGNGVKMTNSSSTNIITIQKDYVTLEEFGGASDGTTDNLAAFNLAIAAGKKIVLAAGTYATSGTWLINQDGVELSGSGKFTTVVKPLASFNRTVDSALVRIGSAAYRPANVTVKDMRIAASYGSDGNNVSGLMIDADFNTDVLNCWLQGGNYITRPTGAIYIAKSKHLRFTDCNFTNSYSYAIYVRGAAYDDTTIRGCQFDENQADIIVINTGYFQDLKINTCSFGHSYDAAVGYQTPIRHTLIKNTTSGGINNLSVTNCTFSSSTASPTNTYIDLISTTGSVMIQSNTFTNAKKWAIIKKGSGAITILDNTFDNNGRAKGGGTVYTDVGANNEDTSPYFYGDVWISDGGYYGGRVANNKTNQASAVVVCARPTSNDITYQNVSYEGNKAYTHGRILGIQEMATSAPSNGAVKYLQGEYVKNSNPNEQGTAGSKYIIKGWICTVSGWPGTWMQDRALTGN